MNESLRALAVRLDGILADAPLLPESCRLLVLGGKRLRARLLLGSVRDAGQRAAGLSAAAAMELLHAASLIHDDIVDHCASRRGLPAVHHVVGVRAAGLSGWWLIQVAMSMLAGLPGTVRSRFADIGGQLGRGQFVEILHAYDVRLLPEMRIAIMEAKTASVFGLACELGGMLNGDEQQRCQELRNFGTVFGMLFQIADDLDDLLAPQACIGRSPGSDLRRGVISLPIAFALQSPAAREVASIIETAAYEREVPLERFTTLLHVSGAIEQARSAAARYAHAARRHVSTLGTSSATKWMASLTEATFARVARYAQ
jgi:heptaprenyl diphosphate synthase